MPCRPAAAGACTGRQAGTVCQGVQVPPQVQARLDSEAEDDRQAAEQVQTRATSVVKDDTQAGPSPVQQAPATSAGTDRPAAGQAHLQKVSAAEPAKQTPAPQDPDAEDGELAEVATTGLPAAPEAAGTRHACLPFLLLASAVASPGTHPCTLAQTCQRAVLPNSGRRAAARGRLQQPPAAPRAPAGLPRQAAPGARAAATASREARPQAGKSTASPRPSEPGSQQSPPRPTGRTTAAETTAGAATPALLACAHSPACTAVLCGVSTCIALPCHSSLLPAHQCPEGPPCRRSGQPQAP